MRLVSIVFALILIGALSACTAAPAPTATPPPGFTLTATITEAQINTSLSNAVANAINTGPILVTNVSADLQPGQIIFNGSTTNGTAQIIASAGAQNGVLNVNVNTITLGGTTADAATIQRVNDVLRQGVQTLTGQVGNLHFNSVTISDSAIDISLTVRTG
jgi:hypothetical protein